MRDSASITSEKAPDLKVIDLVARDLPDLLRQLDGRTIGERVLQTARGPRAGRPDVPRDPGDFSRKAGRISAVSAV